MKQSDAWYLNERAENLALVHLTRRSDLIVTHPTHGDIGLDLLVTIAKDNKQTGRVFGVIIKAAILAMRRHRRGEHRVQLYTPRLKLIQDLPFPVCLFFFVMENDASYYTWLKEPSRDGDGLILAYRSRGPISIEKSSPNLAPLNQESMDTIVSRVDNWYNLLSNTTRPSNK